MSDCEQKSFLQKLFLDWPMWVGLAVGMLLMFVLYATSVIKPSAKQCEKIKKT